MSVQDTSRAAYDALGASLPNREQLVWDALKRTSPAPTAYELFQSMRLAGLAFDINAVRPRLTMLSERGCVERIGKRVCKVTGRLAYTWRVRLGHPPIVEAVKRGHDLNAPQAGKLL